MSSPLRREMAELSSSGDDMQQPALMGNFCYRASHELNIPAMEASAAAHDNLFKCCINVLQMLLLPKASVKVVSAFHEVCLHEITQVKLTRNV